MVKFIFDKRFCCMRERKMTEIVTKSCHTKHASPIVDFVLVFWNYFFY